MSAQLGGSQLSSLLESVPGLASVLRSPVADAIVNVVRAGAGLAAFNVDDARELIEYATRRGLIPSAEGDEVLVEVQQLAGKRGRGKRSAKGSGPAKKTARKVKSPKSLSKSRSKVVSAKQAKKAAKKKPTKAGGKPAKTAKKKASKSPSKRR